MRLQFRDILKENAWDSQQRGWQYSWLRIPSVHIRSLEVGGETISSSDYEIDRENGTILWKQEGHPDHISVTVRFYEPFWKKWLVMMAVLVLVGAGMFWLGKSNKFLSSSTSPFPGIKQKYDSLLTELKEVRQARADSDTSNGTHLAKVNTQLEESQDEQAALQRQNTELRSSNTALENAKMDLIRQIRQKEEEIQLLRNAPKQPFLGYTALFFCSDNTYCRSQTVQRAKVKLAELGITSKWSKSVSTNAKVKTLIAVASDERGKQAVAQLLPSFQSLGLVNRTEEIPSAIAQKTIYIHID